MCLTIKRKSDFWPLLPKIALKPITVYKVLRTDRHPKQVWAGEAPFQSHFEYKWNKRYFAKIRNVKKYGYYDPNKFAQGFHSIVSLEDAEYVAYKFNQRMNTRFRTHRYEVVEFTIPRFSKYYTGIWHDVYGNFESIVSNSIIARKPK